MPGIDRILPAQAASEGGDSCMNALKVIHGFALINGPCNLFVIDLAPLFTSDISTYIKEVAGKQDYSCRPEEYELLSRRICSNMPLIYTLFA